MMRNITLAVIITTLIGCGGGDDDSNGGSNNNAGSQSTSQQEPVVQLSTTRLEAQNNGVISPNTSVQLTLNESEANNTFYLTYEQEAQSYVSDVSFDEIDAANVIVYFELEPGYKLGEGTHNETLDLNICRDSACTNPIDGSPFKLDFSYTVSLPESVSLNIPSTQQIIRETDDTQTAYQLSSVATISGFPDASASHAAHYRIRSNHPSIDHLFVWVANNELNVNQTLKSVDQLSEGVTSEKIYIDACYDTACVYPISGSPLELTLEHNLVDVTPNTPTDKLTHNKQVLLSHNVIDAEYMKDSSFLILTSTSPSNSVYIYNTSIWTYIKFDLAAAPTSLSIDEIDTLGRFAIGHANSVTIFDLDTLTPANTSSKTIDLGFEVYDQAVKGEYLWAISNTEQWGNLTTVKISNSEITSSSGQFYRHSSNMKISPNGNQLYLMSTVGSPRDLYRADISVPSAPAGAVDSQYIGEYRMCPSFWITEDASSLIDQCGNRFSLSEVEADDMVYSGKMDRLDTSIGWDHPLIHITEASATQFAAVDKEDIAGIRFYDKATLTQSGHYSLMDYDVEVGVHAQTIPLMAFSHRPNELLIVTRSTHSGTDYFTLIELISRNLLLEQFPDN
ncbi:hypothetical protein [Vibrio mexicanus]|uniref:hypothetical protein n=1 Tax=Vibrio mexicanus TaxID=1004326 RepID=UPI00063C2A26|nr:hypothetical protein [Vibrio mexicanus]